MDSADMVAMDSRILELEVKELRMVQAILPVYYGSSAGAIIARVIPCGLFLGDGDRAVLVRVPGMGIWRGGSWDA